MKKIFHISILIINILCAQSFDSSVFHDDALSALNNNDTTLAKELFRKSIREDENPDSYFELAKILLNNQTPSNSYKAQKYLNRAILISEDDIKYRMKLADAVKARYPMYAYDIYKKVIEKDSNNLNAWMEISKIKEIQCRELSRLADVFSNRDLSFIKTTDAYKETMSAVRKILTIDKSNTEASTRLSLLYSYTGEYDKAVEILKSITSEDSPSLDAMLYLGFLYSRGNKYSEASEVYTQALELMSEEDRRIFTSESVHEIFFDDLLKKFGLKEEDNTREFTTSYVRSKDPLYLTDYNERLLEHFTRLVYSNLHFSIPRMNIKGWQSDRGEIFIRYGYPLKITQVNSSINMLDFPNSDYNGSESLELHSFGSNFEKAEIWFYGNLTLAFENLFMNNNYVFNSSPNFIGPTGRFAPKSPVGLDTEHLIEGGLRSLIPEEFDPGFEGPTLMIAHNYYQLKDIENNRTDIYLNYAIDKRDGVVYNNKFAYRHKYGVFILDNLFYKVHEIKNSLPGLDLENKITINDTSTFFVNTVPINTELYSGNFAFELIRERDKGVSANRRSIKEYDFSGDSLSLSDVILATNINNIENKGATIKRNEIEILPNPTNTFSNQTPLYIYYEAYNLKLAEDKFTDFEQEIAIQEFEEPSGIENAVNSFLETIGINEERKKITLSSNYRTKEKNPQVYFKLDMSGYESGKYLVELKITDNLKTKNITKSTILYWQ